MISIYTRYLMRNLVLWVLWVRSGKRLHWVPSSWDKGVHCPVKLMMAVGRIMMVIIMTMLISYHNEKNDDHFFWELSSFVESYFLFLLFKYSFLIFFFSLWRLIFFCGGDGRCKAGEEQVREVTRRIDQCTLRNTFSHIALHYSIALYSLVHNNLLHFIAVFWEASLVANHLGWWCCCCCLCQNFRW